MTQPSKGKVATKIQTNETKQITGWQNLVCAIAPHGARSEGRCS